MANLNIKTALTGGTVNCVDRNSAGMKVSGSVCFALIDGSPNVLRVYRFDAASTATANGDTVIIPYGQSGGTAGRWLQQGIMIGSLTPELLGYIGNLTSDAQTQLNEIQTQIGSYRGVLSSSAATVTLTAEHRGNLVVLYSGSAQTVYLPQETGLPVGWTVTILKETLTGTVLIDPSGQIDSGNGLVNSLSVRGMEEARLTWDGTYWRLGGGALRVVGEAARTYHNLTASRSLGVTYTNTTPYIKTIILGVRDNNVGAIPSFVLDGQTYSFGVDIPGQAVVTLTIDLLPGSSFNMGSAGCVLSYWLEIY